MKYEYYDRYVNKNTEGRYDVTPIFNKPEVFSNLLDDLIEPFSNMEFDKIAGPDALGFILGGALAFKLCKGFVPVRKGGKLPGVKGTVVSTSFTDYSNTQKTLEISITAINKGERILLVDEWIETGSQMLAAISLIKELGGIVSGISALAADQNDATRILFDRYGLKAINIRDGG